MTYKSTRNQYLNFFNNWLNYQYGYPEYRIHNVLVLSEVKKIICDDDEAAYWGDRDCWTVFYMAEKALKARAIA
jgi:hypothetical protein